MQKFKTRLTTGLSVIVLSVALFAQTTGSAKADDYTWIDAPQLYLTKVQDVQLSEIPLTVWGGGNTDCVLDGTICAVSTTYGLAGNSELKLTGTSQYYPVTDYTDSYNRFWPIPNSDDALTQVVSSGIGNYAFFYNDIPNSLDSVYSNLTLDHYKINHANNGRLNDKSGNPQLLDFGSVGFSSTSDWMIATRPGVAILRVDTSTHDVLPFGLQMVISYDQGQQPSYTQAITDSGRWAAVAVKNHSQFAIYDLSTCGTVPSTINGPVSCQYRDLNIQSGFMSQQVPGYIGTRYMRFVDDNNIDLYVSYLDGGTTKYAEYTLSTTN